MADKPPFRLTVASPCRANWGEMTGDAQKRFCALCKKNVYDLTAMRWEEVKALLDAPETPCVRFFQREDGTVMTADCPVGRERKWRRLRLRAVLSSVAALVLSAVGYFRYQATRTRGCGMASTLPPEDAAKWARAMGNVPFTLPQGLAPPPAEQSDSWMEERRARLPGGPPARTLAMGRLHTIGIIRGSYPVPEKK